MDVYTRRRLVAGGILAAIVLLIIALIAGGGDDDEPESVTTTGATTAGVTPLGRGQLAAEANLICEEADAARDDLEAIDDLELIRREVEIATDELNQLRALQDSADDPAFDRFVAALRRQVRLLDRQAIATERGDGTSVVELQSEVDAAESRVTEAAEAAGLDSCAGNAGGGGGRREGETETGEAPDTGGVAPAPAPAEPAPAEPAPAPAEPAPAPAPDTGGGATPAPAPAPDDGGGGTGGDTGGTTPGGTGGISP